MRTLAVVPARGGSKGIPRKNFRNFCGKPLATWAVEIGLETCDHVLLSSDVEEASILAPFKGVTFRHVMAPLHTDTCPMIDVVTDALETVPDAEVVVLLQPTSPLRTALHVREALLMLEKCPVTSVFSVVGVPPEYHPDWTMPLIMPSGEFPGRLLDKMATRRQNLGPRVARDGTVYAMRAECIRAGSLYGPVAKQMVIPPSQSCNINNWDDWHRAEQMMRDRNGLPQAG